MGRQHPRGLSQPSIGTARYVAQRRCQRVPSSNQAVAPHLGHSRRLKVQSKPHEEPRAQTSHLGLLCSVIASSPQRSNHVPLPARRKRSPALSIKRNEPRNSTTVLMPETIQPGGRDRSAHGYGSLPRRTNARESGAKVAPGETAARRCVADRAYPPAGERNNAAYDRGTASSNVRRCYLLLRSGPGSGCDIGPTISRLRPRPAEGYCCG